MKQVFTMMLAAMLMIGSSFAYAEDVYVTKNGKKYHKADCLLVSKKGAKPIALDEALKKGLKPCRKCFGASDTSVDKPAGIDAAVPVTIPPQPAK